MAENVLTETALPTQKTKGWDEEFCSECGTAVKIKAEICPHCGVRKLNAPGVGRLSKVALVLLTFFFGGIGVHKFYVGRYLQGAFYLLFCWTGIPSLIAFIEFLVYAFTDERTLQERYPSASGGAAFAALALFFGGLFMIFILVAMAGV